MSRFPLVPLLLLAAVPVGLAALFLVPLVPADPLPFPGSG